VIDIEGIRPALDYLNTDGPLTLTAPRGLHNTIQALLGQVEEARAIGEAYRQQAVTNAATVTELMAQLREARIEVVDVRARYADIEKCISWGVSDVATARFLDAVREQEERAERAEETVIRLRAALFNAREALARAGAPP